MENDDTNVTEVHSLIGVSHQRILINSLISFPNLAPEKVLINIMHLILNYFKKELLII